MAARCALGAYPANLQRGSRISAIYGGATEISERHRHRYEININYRDRLEQHGLRFAGLSPDGVLPETVELEGHPWFIGVQFHPELKSRPVRTAPAVRLVHRRGGRAEPAGLGEGAGVARQPMDPRKAAEAAFRQPGVAPPLQPGPKAPVVPGAKEQVTLRIDREVLDFFQEDGPGWQDRINAALRKAAGK